MSVKTRPYRGKKNEYEVDIRFEWPDGDEHRERVKAPVSARSGAQRWGEAREREYLTRGKPKPSEEVRVVPTLREFYPRYVEEYCKAEKQKQSTIENKQLLVDAHLFEMFGASRLDGIDDAAIQRVKARLHKHAAKSVNNVLSLLSSILKRAVEWKVIRVMPCTIKLLKVHYGERPFYDFDDFDRLVEGATKTDRRAEIAVLLGGEAGLRRGELMALRWSNVLFARGDHGVIRVVESVYNGNVTLPKNGRTREVPMTPRLSRVLHAFRHLVGPQVLHDEGRAVNGKVLREWLKAAERRAGMEAKGLVHILRHTFCSHLAMLGAPAKAVQELAGHASLTTTMRYMHLSPAARSSAVALLDARLKGGAVAGVAGDGHGEMMEKGQP